MKKRLFVAALVVLGSLGVATAIRAQVAPTVSAGSAQTITLPTNSVTLAGTASSVNGSISTYAWTEVSGGAATIATPTAATTVVNNLVQGSYTFRLTATDSTNVSASSDVVVTVNPAITNPVIGLGSTQTIVLPVSTVILTNSATAPTGRTITGYNWVQTSGPATSVITTPTAATTSVTGLTTAGTYVFTLTATDNTGATGSGTVRVLVNTQATINPNPGRNKAQLEINSNGNVNLRGAILSISGGVITTNVWGINFTINTIANTTNFAVGDFIQVNGRISSTASVPTINARSVRDISAHAASNNNSDNRKNKNEKDGDNKDVSFGRVNNGNAFGRNKSN